MSSKMILACIDGSELSESVIDHAIWLAKTSDSSLQFLHTVEHSHQAVHSDHAGSLTPNLKEHLLDELTDEEHAESKKRLAEGKSILETAKQKSDEAGLADVTVRQRHGTISEALMDLESGASLLVLGAKGEDHSGNKQGLGAQLEGAIRASHTPVLIVKNSFKQPKKMLFAFNGSPTSSKILKLLADGELFNENVDIHVVSVQDELADAKALIDQASVVLAQSNFNVSTRALEGDAAEQLIAYQQEYEVDMCCMGAFSHGKVHGFFFGSFTTAMLVESNTNFLLVR